jgi:hypothetical protein
VGPFTDGPRRIGTVKARDGEGFQYSVEFVHQHITRVHPAYRHIGYGQHVPDYHWLPRILPGLDPQVQVRRIGRKVKPAHVAQRESPGEQTTLALGQTEIIDDDRNARLESDDALDELD